MNHNCKLTYFLGLGLGTLLITGTALQAPVDFSIIDTHEHIENISSGELLLLANDEVKVSKTILIPSPIETITLNGNQSFTGYRENVDAILELAATNPKRFVPFCTVSPLDSDALEYIKDCHARGGMGIKLYNGHTYYYNIFQMPLDAVEMMPIYDYAEQNNLPIVLHANIATYGTELESVLDAHPNLVMSVPHFMVSSLHLDEVGLLLDKYPNLYTDISFGSPQFLAAGLRRISRNPGTFANFINQYSEQVLFGTDMVISEAEYKDQAFIEQNIKCYRDMLEQRSYECSPVYSYYKSVLDNYKERYASCEPAESEYCASLKENMSLYEERYNQVETLSGLSLSNSVLKNVYEKNALRFLGQPVPTDDESEKTMEALPTPTSADPV